MKENQRKKGLAKYKISIHEFFNLGQVRLILKMELNFNYSLTAPMIYSLNETSERCL